MDALIASLDIPKYYVTSVYYKHGDHYTKEFKYEGELKEYLWKEIVDSLNIHGNTKRAQDSSYEEIFLSALEDGEYIDQRDCYYDEVNYELLEIEVDRAINIITLKDLVKLSISIGRCRIENQLGYGVVKVIKGICL